MSEQEVFDRLKYRVEVDEYGTYRYYNTAGRLHRTDGPAVVSLGGYKAWYINDRMMTEDEFNQAVKDYV